VDTDMFLFTYKQLLVLQNTPANCQAVNFYFIKAITCVSNTLEIITKLIFMNILKTIFFSPSKYEIATVKCNSKLLSILITIMFC